MNWLLSTDNRTWSRLSDPGIYISLPVRVAIAVTLGPDRGWRVACKLRSTGRSGAEIDMARPIGPYWNQPVSGAEAGKRLGDVLIATFEQQGWAACKAQFRGSA
jgi:hypothetical protein